MKFYISSKNNLSDNTSPCDVYKYFYMMMWGHYYRISYSYFSNLRYRDIGLGWFVFCTWHPTSWITLCSLILDKEVCMSDQTILWIICIFYILFTDCAIWLCFGVNMKINWRKQLQAGTFTMFNNTNILVIPVAYWLRLIPQNYNIYVQFDSSRS